MPKNDLKFYFRNDGVNFKINAKCHAFESVLNAAHVFIDKFYVFFDGDPKSAVSVFLKPKNESASRKEIAKAAGEFANEILNQELRLQLAKNNKQLREYIVGQALFGASPEQMSKKEEDASEKELDKILEKELKALEAEEKKAAKKEKTGKKDPLNILAPWAGKTGKKKKSA